MLYDSSLSRWPGKGCHPGLSELGQADMCRMMNAGVFCGQENILVHCAIKCDLSSVLGCLHTEAKSPVYKAGRLKHSQS